MKQVIFAGGIHGVGKSTLFREIASKLSINCLSASELLKWSELNTDKKNKKVLNIADTQKRLLKGLNAIIQPGETYILDGHYCLLNNDGDVKNVPIATFEQIDPISLILVTGNIADIKIAIDKRDQSNFDIQQLSALQDAEIAYAQSVATHLNIPLFHFKNHETSKDRLILKIHESLT